MYTPPGILPQKNHSTGVPYSWAYSCAACSACALPLAQLGLNREQPFRHPVQVSPAKYSSRVGPAGSSGSSGASGSSHSSAGGSSEETDSTGVAVLSGVGWGVSWGVGAGVLFGQEAAPQEAGHSETAEDAAGALCSTPFARTAGPEASESPCPRNSPP